MNENDSSKGLLGRIVVDRPAPQAALAVGATWIALLAVMARDVAGIAELVMTGLIGLAAIVLGFAAASRCRPMLQQRTFAERARLGGLTVALGAAMGAANLGANYLMAMIHPSIHEQLVQRFARISAWHAVVDSPVTEEITFRLVLFSCVAWVIGKSVKRPGLAFVAALLISSVVFGVLHILRPMPLEPDLALAYKIGVALKSTLLGVGLGWVYWRWGLPYSMLAHGVANGAHALLEPLAF